MGLKGQNLCFKLRVKCLQGVKFTGSSEKPGRSLQRWEQNAELGRNAVSSSPLAELVLFRAALSKHRLVWTVGKPGKCVGGGATPGHWHPVISDEQTLGKNILWLDQGLQVPGSSREGWPAPAARKDKGLSPWPQGGCSPGDTDCGTVRASISFCCFRPLTVGCNWSVCE